MLYIRYTFNFNIGSTIELPFQLNSSQSIYSFGAELEFDPDIFQLKQIITTDITQKWALTYHQNDDILRFALTGSEAVNGSEILAIVRLDIAPDVKTGDSHYLDVHRLSIDEIEIIEPLAKIQFIAQNAIPTSFQLLQNYPNPFNALTNIRFGLPEKGRVKLKIYNLQGQEVRMLLDETWEAGYHSIYFDGKNNHGQHLSSGVYIYQLQINSDIATKKIIII